MDENEVQDLLDEMALNEKFVSTARVFNKPSLISISSADREPEDANQTPYSQVGFSSFSVNLPRPALEVDSIQLVSSSLPQCNNTIPDTAAAFWYYRVSAYSGFIPNPNNLFMNRLLPSYYKLELIDQSALFGYNKTFNNYAALSTEMAKASTTDLAYYNWINVVRPALEGVKLDLTANTYIPYRPNDFLVSYNSTINKFQGTGFSIAPASAAYSSGTTYALGAVVATPLAYTPWNSGVTYAIGDIVIVNYVLYRSLQNGNVGHQVNDEAFWKSIGDLCFWNRPQTWQSLQASNTNHTPASSPTWWKEIGVEFIQPWSADITYNKGRYVTYGGVTYESTAQVWSNIPSTLNGWKVSTREYFYRYLITGPRDPLVAPAQAGVDPFTVDIIPPLQWNQYNLYEVGDRVEYEGQLWRCVQQNQNGIPMQVNTIWNAITAYDAGDIVRYRGVVYQALVIVSVYDPENYPAYWAVVTYWGWDNCEWVSSITYNRNDPVIYGGVTFQLGNPSSFNSPPPLLWSTGTAYLAEDVVIFGQRQYQCIQPNSNRQPDTFPQFWAYLETPIEEVPAWISSTDYVVGNIVEYGGDKYACIEDNVDFEPDASPTKWAPLSSVEWDYLKPELFAAPSYGLYTTSATLDFVEQTAVAGEILLPFPVGIQAQPFTPVPKRLLNSIVGFTFNGIFNPTAFDALNLPAEQRGIPTQVTSLFNRTRPVPIYDVIIGTAPLGLRDQAATATRVYTADGYCNLVYSSIISTYCDIVGASSIDTQQTTNLLAVNTMNCGNLGISFYAPFIDNPLTKMQNDIYTIFVEFRDEFGDLYHFTNNAVVTLTFKVTYKK